MATFFNLEEACFTTAQLQIDLHKILGTEVRAEEVLISKAVRDREGAFGVPEAILSRHVVT